MPRCLRAWCINADCFASHQPRFGQPLKDPRKNRLMRFQINQPTGARDRRVVGWPLGQLQIQKSPQRKRIGGTPRYSTLRIESFEVPDHQQSKITTRRQTWPPHCRRIERCAQPLNVRIEPDLIHNPIQTLVKRMRGRSRQIVRGYPYRRLSRSAITFSHCHATECTMPALFWQNNRGYFPLSTNQPDRLSPRPVRASRLVAASIAS